METYEVKLMDHLKPCSIPEESIIEPLLASSREFKFFYRSEQGKIKSQIIWLDYKKFYKTDIVPEGVVFTFNVVPEM